MFIPTKVFLTKGVGVHKDKLVSFEMALRDAGIEKCNLVFVSSILPPYCKMISREEGLKLLKPGEITFCVLSKNETNKPHRLIAAAIGLAIPKQSQQYGYLAEHHAFDQEAKIAGEYAEDLAVTMLATALGISFNLRHNKKERKTFHKGSQKIFKTQHICQLAQGDRDGLWTTVIAAVVLLR